MQTLAESLNVDPNEPQRGASDPRASVWVAASAGTGKTKVLSDRVLRLMLNGTDPRRILCLTYTKAAAAEMANRMAERLGSWATADDARLAGTLRDLLGRQPSPEQRQRARALFAQVLDTPGGLSICTIHAFCQSLLGRFPLEAGIAPHAEAMDERDAKDLQQQALHHLLLAAPQVHGPLAAALASVSRHLGETRFADILERIFTERTRFTAMISAHGSVAAAANAARTALGLAEGETVAQVVAGACAEGTFDAPALRRAADALGYGSKAECARAEMIVAWLEAAPAARADMFDAYARIFLTDPRKSPKIREDKCLATKATEKVAPGTLAAMQEEAARLLCVLPRRRAAITAAATESLLVLGDTLLHLFDRLKQSRALLDYEDLIEGALRLLHGEGAGWVLYKLDGGIDHLLIDEAQDTSPAQWRILKALTAEFFAGEGAHQPGRTVFAVGDVKQSIFSFQGANPAEFIASRDSYARQVTAALGHWRPIEMQTSFRSTRAVLAAVDATFKPTEMAYAIALEQTLIVHYAYRKLDGGTVELWPPVRPRAPEKPLAWEPPVTRIEADSPQTRLADLIALRIAAMLDNAEMLESQGRPIRAGDIMVLVRRRTEFMQALIRALKERSVPVAGIDRMLLTEQLAVMDLTALIRFALLPQDDLVLATVLKGPLVGFDDDALFALAHDRSGSLWSTLTQRAASCPLAASAYRFLTSLLADADQMAPFEFLVRALGPLPSGEDDSHAGPGDDDGVIADSGRRRLLARLGRDAEDPIAELLELALTFERVHPPSLQGFLSWLDRTAIPIQRDPQTGEADAVRVMTVHGAKGLQAPIVFLPDSCQTPAKQFPLLWLQGSDGREVLLWPPRSEFREAVAEAALREAALRQMQEHMRLLYVAMTRAADRLIVCGWLTANQHAPEEDSWHRKVGEGLRLDGPASAVIEHHDPFLSGMPHLIDDVRALRLSYPQQAMPASQPASTAPAAEPLPAWALQKAPQEPPSLRPLRPSHPADGPVPTVLSPLDAEQRFRRGRLIHRLLQELPELPAAQRNAAAQRWLARPTHGLDPTMQQAIAHEVMAVINSSELAPLFAPGSRAEVPLSGEIGGWLIAGQVDRLVVGAATVTVLDYKSDRPAPRSAEAIAPAYLQQMAAYRTLLRHIYPGHTIRCVLLWTERPLAMLLDDAALDRWVP